MDSMTFRELEIYLVKQNPPLESSWQISNVDSVMVVDRNKRDGKFFIPSGDSEFFLWSTLVARRKTFPSNLQIFPPIDASE